MSSEFGLSSREREVLALVARGLKHDEIAVAMEISRHTVLSFVRRIYLKLNVKSRAEAIFEAKSRGLLFAVNLDNLNVIPADNGCNSDPFLA